MFTIFYFKHTTTSCRTCLQRIVSLKPKPGIALISTNWNKIFLALGLIMKKCFPCIYLSWENGNGSWKHFLLCSDAAQVCFAHTAYTGWVGDRKRLWCWEGLGAGGEGDNRGWDGWMASLTRWTWVWVNSGSWWWTGRPGVLRFMGSQRVGHDRATELIWSDVLATILGTGSEKDQGLALV